MKRPFLTLVGVLLLVLSFGFGWKTFGRSVEEQLLDAQTDFLEQVEKRNWSGVSDWMTENYLDEFAQDRDTAVEVGRRVLAHFYVLTLLTEIAEVQAMGSRGIVRANLKIEGNGAGLSQVVLTEVNRLQEPWEFTWRNDGGWPWTWRIEKIHHPSLVGRNFSEGF